LVAPLPTLCARTRRPPPPKLGLAVRPVRNTQDRVHVGGGVEKECEQVGQDGRLEDGLTHLLKLFLYPPPHMHAALCIAHWPHSKTKLWRERTTSSGAKGWQRSYQPVLRALRRAPTLLSWCVNSSMSFLCLPGASCRLLVHLRLAPHSHHPLPTPLFFFCCGREGKDRER